MPSPWHWTSRPEGDARALGEPPYDFIRRAVFEPIDSYQGPIPDEALLKYDAAVQSGLFSAFSVVTPAYFSQKQVDPWIVAQVDGAELYAVIAQWDDAGELRRAPAAPRRRAG